ncbi:MAG: aminopeptidase P family protein [Lachnospiraceae bacterium]|nr:aminopeptidase P family protein [Lachnospiraceae bacterium]
MIKARLQALRSAMQVQGIDFYLMPTADFHNSEYVNDYFKVREFFSGFTGSNGTLVVWQEGAGLWTDGRYFIQAERELAGSGIELFRMMQEGVPTISEFLAQSMMEGQTLGFDGRCVSAKGGAEYEEALADKNIKFVYRVDLAEGIWAERPAFPCGKTFGIKDEVAGAAINEKLSQVREQLKKDKAESIFLAKLDDIMWLYNIRGCDVECNPVALSYTYVTMTESYLFIQKEALTPEVEKHLTDSGVIVEEYEKVWSFLEGLQAGQKVSLDKRNASFQVCKVLEKQNLVEAASPTELLKAKKNSTELKYMEEIYLKDSVAVTKFIYWVKNAIGKQTITELDAAEYMDNLRREIPEFIDLSFPTIAAYGANAAMMHYEATEESHAVLEPKGMLLVDSGGQYMGGTTDVTRTIVLGEISDEIKKHYTLTAAGMLELTHARWIYGCTGRNLDILARKPLWDIGIDYQCGTGHGIGYILNVHEGPQNVRWRFAPGTKEVAIEEGMIISNEPGVYIADSHGIRIENIVVARNDSKNEYGQFMHFDTLTYAPIDLEAIDVSLLSQKQREYLNEYHKAVYEKVSPFLNDEEKQWLLNATKEI